MSISSMINLLETFSYPRLPSSSLIAQWGEIFKLRDRNRKVLFIKYFLKGLHGFEFLPVMRVIIGVFI